MKSSMLFVASVLFSAHVFAQSPSILRGDSLKSITLDEALEVVSPGSIILIGENHGLKAHQEQQLSIMQALRNKGLKVAVGLEFFTYTQQDALELYRAGQLSEGDFLNKMQWGSPSYDFYRDQAQFPNPVEGTHTVALNAPRSLTGKVSKTGLDSLSPDEQALLPPQFSLGRSSYKTRFLATMGGHLPSVEAGDRYFAAQSIWDDTMAWNATRYIEAHADQVLVVVVGEFHVQYGGGFPDRIHARAPGVRVHTFSQINTSNLSAEEVTQEVTPSSDYGPRADILLVGPAEGPGL